MRKGPRLRIRNTILMTVCIILSIPGFILYELFKNKTLNWKELKPLNFLMEIYYIVISRIFKIMMKDISVI